MGSLHLANTDFELELVRSKTLHLEESLRVHPIVHQLQFLPALYAAEEDRFCVTDCPDSSFKGSSWRLLSEDLPLGSSIDAWAPSKSIAQWAQERGLRYQMPDWEVVKEVNSKSFSFQQVPPLPGAALISGWNELQAWIQQTPGPKVLKSCFGVSGRGHLHLPAPPEKIKTFAMDEWSALRPLIAEPWVLRKLDFSTQWLILKEGGIDYIGSTIVQCDGRGSYRGNQVGEEEKIFGRYFPYLQDHQTMARQTLGQMRKLGFFGNVGIDAMIWGDDCLHPIVEINARKTMGWVSLQIAKRLFPNQTITVSYDSASCRPALLPWSVVLKNGKLKKFSRNLHVDVLAN